VLTSYDVSSLVIDKLCDQSARREFVVACFYFDFADQEKQSSTCVLGALLKQIVGGLEEIPVEIAQAYEDQKRIHCRPRLLLDEIVEMLRATASRKRTFICIDALDECAEGCRVKLLDSLNKILRGAPGSRMFVTGRPQILDQVTDRLPSRVKTIHITPKRRNIISYLHSRLKEDPMSTEMNGSLKKDILKRIPKATSKMYVEKALAPRKLSQVLH